MTAPLVDIRDEIFTRIGVAKAASSFVLNGFTVERTWLPWSRLEDLDDNGKVYVIGQAGDDEDSKGRNDLSMIALPVQVGLQYPNVAFTDRTTIDTLVELYHQLRELCRTGTDLDRFSWVRNEALKDENGTVYAFVGLREASVFEAYFTAYYNYVLQP